MDKLRACIVANYYANAGLTKIPEVNTVYIFTLSPVRLLTFILNNNNNSIMYTIFYIYIHNQ